MTSNIGAGKLTKEAAKIGFKTLIDSEKEDKAYEEKCEEVISELKENVRPEFLNRVDHVIVFNALHQEHIRKIVNIHIDMLTNRLKEKGYKLEIDQKAVNFLAEKGFDQEYGARPVRRVIQEHVEDEIAEHILKGIFNTGDTICVIKKKDKEALDFMPKEVSKKPKVKKAPPKAKAKAA